MKVLIVTNMYPTQSIPFYGIFVKEQVESLKEKGIAIDVHFINGKQSRANYFKCVREIMSKISRNKYDIIHMHHTYCVYPVFIAMRLCGRRIPTLLTFHEGEIHKSKDIRNNGFDVIKRLVYSRNIKQRALDMVDFVIFVQRDMVDCLEFNGRYEVIPCGVDLDLFKPLEKEWCRRKLGLPIDRKIIFFPASPENVNKGIELLRQAVKHLDRADIDLITAGSINHDEMPTYMSAADVIVQLSDFEASPMVLKEAMAVSVPVVFSDVGDVRIVIGDAEGCFISRRSCEDVAFNISNALGMTGRSAGRWRIIESRLALSEIADRVIDVYNCLT